jgi:hypothetical protein
MKTKIFAIAAILILTVSLSFAKDPKSLMQQSIKSQIDFPVYASEKNLEGAVFVEFTVNADKKVEVMNCNSLVGELQSYVYNKVSGLTVEVTPDLIGQTFLMRFDFNLEK